MEPIYTKDLENNNFDRLTYSVPNYVETIVPRKDTDGLRQDIIMLIDWIKLFIENNQIGFAEDYSATMYFISLIKMLEVINHESYDVNESVERLLNTLQEKYQINTK